MGSLMTYEANPCCADLPTGHASEFVLNAESIVLSIDFSAAFDI